MADRSYSMGTPFCCIQLSGVRLMGLKVLKKHMMILKMVIMCIIHIITIITIIALIVHYDNYSYYCNYC